jgi:starch synthase
MSGRKVLSVVSELYPLVKTGGLADVAGALPAALGQLGLDVVTLVPGYPAVMAALGDASEVFASPDMFGGRGRVLAGKAAGLTLFVLDAPHLFGRSGNPYMGPDGRDWPDNAMRFGALSWTAARIGLGEVPAFVPDVIHGHDWQAGLTMAYLAYAEGRRPATVLTVHNLAYQGRFDAGFLAALRLPPPSFAIEGVEFYGGIGFLKAGLQFADHITTVSPSYAAEIQTPSEGCGLDALLRARAGSLSGILNGIDIEVWNPATDARIPAPYDRSSIALRAPNKAALQRRFGLDEDPQRLLFGMVTRFTWQKGIDLLAETVPALLATGAQLVLLGTGEYELEQRLTALADQDRNRVGCIVGYDEDLAHLIQAGSDALLVPSRFEPCGLTQLCALRYGAVPVVAKVGGLADTVIDLETDPAATGIQFSPVTTGAFAAALRRAAAVWDEQPAWSRLQQSGMAVDVSWSRSAARYAQLYAAVLTAKE